MSRYLRTALATEWPAPSRTIAGRFGEKILKYLSANPDYEGSMHEIKEWLIEFDENSLPWREIGLDEFGKIVIAGPDEDNYGFWLDTNMKFEDFEGDEIEASEFEKYWDKSNSK